MRFGSVCSGIEAASIAWSHLGWKAAWLAEVDVSASAVLAHRFGATAPRYPAAGTEKSLNRIQWGDQLVNWGDMTRLPEAVRTGAAEAPDILCGGTPCQGFSLAGLRGGLSDPRGQLTLSFVELANVIDDRRASLGQHPCVIFWENVPGVRSDSDNAFGHFLAALVGVEDPVEPGPRPEPGRSSTHWSWKKETGEHVPRWPSAGVVAGPRRTVAWRSSDAQYAGLAQRRERVFLVASAREGFDPQVVLLEFDGLRRDTAPSREAGEGVAGTLAARTDGGGFPGTDKACSGYVQPHRPFELSPQWWDGSPVRQTLDAVLHKGQTMPEKNRFPAVLQPVIPILEAGARTGREGHESRDGLGVGQAGDPMFTLQSSKQHAVAVLPFNTTQITSPDNGSNPQWGDPCFSLAAGNHPRAVAISVALRGREGGGTAELGDEVAGTLRASGGGGDKPHVLTVHGTQDPIIGHDLALTLGRNNGAENAVCVTGDLTHALMGVGFDASEDSTGRGTPIVAFQKCKIDTCFDRVHAHGLCSSHANRLRRHGDPLAGRTKEGAPSAFLKSLLGTTLDDCILWPFAKLPTGYGTVDIGGKTTRAHRAMCRIAHGNPSSEDLDAAHSCGKRLCVNPNHLRWATRIENMSDAIEHGTTTRGEKHAGAVLTEDEVLQIDIRLLSGETHQSISDDFGISRNTVSDISQGKTWQWLTGRGEPIVVHGTQDPCTGKVAFALGRNNGGENALHVPDMAVRRLMPIECERLMGFPDGHTLVPVGKGMAADGPRYKQLGNSWAVPCVSWIGNRLDRHLAELDGMIIDAVSVEVDAMTIWMCAA